MSLEWVNADLQLAAVLKARRKGPAAGSSDGAAGIGLRERGIGGSKATRADEGEQSSRLMLGLSSQITVGP